MGFTGHIYWLFKGITCQNISQNNDCMMILQLYYFLRTHVLLTLKTHIPKLHQHSPITWPGNNDVIQKSLPQATYKKNYF